MLLALVLACTATDPSHPSGLEDIGAAPRPTGPPAPPSAGALPDATPDPGPSLPRPDEDPRLGAFLWEEGRVHDLSLTLDADALHDLDADHEAEVPAELTFGEETMMVGLRLKGNISFRTLSGKPSFKIDVHAFRPYQRFFGLTRLTLNNMVQDKSMMKEHLAYHLYAAMGVAAPRHAYARVTLNGADYGVYGLVESMDQGFIDAHWGDDDEGNLYEGGYGADVHAGVEDQFAVQEDGFPEPPEDLVALVDALDTRDPDELAAALDANFDMDELLTTLAVDLVAGGWDGYARGANNFLLYHAPEADHWHLVPWGQDQSFTDLHVRLATNWNGQLLRRCAEATGCADQLYDRAAAVMAAWDQDDLAGYAAGLAERVMPLCLADARVEIPCQVDDLLDYVDQRPGYVDEELGRR